MILEKSSIATLFQWSERQDLNLRPLDPQSNREGVVGEVGMTAFVQCPVRQKIAIWRVFVTWVLPSIILP